MRALILCVDDEKIILDSLENQLYRSELNNQYEIEIAESGPEALEIVAEADAEGRKLAVVISDQMMPEMTGAELLIRLQESHPNARKILLTGQATFENVTRIVNKAKLYRYVAKPWDPTDLLLTVEEAARSFEQEEKIVKYDEYNKLLKSLHTALQEISSDLAPKLIIERFSRHVVEKCSCEQLFVLLYKSGLNRAEHCYALDQSAAADYEDRLLRDNEAFSEEIMERVYPLMDFHKPVKHQMVIQLVHTSKLMGYALIENPQSKRELEMTDYEIIKMIAAQAAIALENAELYSSIEHQNTSILDSMQYARRIQNGLMPAHKQLTDYFPESFILYKPRDIVSGDFFWMAETDDYIFVVAADCTGHGVPGAFMSILGATQFREIVVHKQVFDPVEILNQLHERVLSNQAKNDKQSALVDGMDLALCRFEKGSRKMTFAGANRPLWLMRDGNIEKFKPSRKSVGYQSIIVGSLDDNFSAIELDLPEGSAVYMFSDGVTDQIGDETNRKFGQKRLKKLLLETADYSMAGQRDALEKELKFWKGTFKQTDDIICVGVRP